MENVLSHFHDCKEMIDILLSKINNDDLCVYSYDIGPFMVAEYKEYAFLMQYNKSYFLRITMLSEKRELLYELMEHIKPIIGEPTVYYDMINNEEDVELKPTIDWWFGDKESYISDVVNDRLFDDGGKCLNIKLFNGKSIEDYKLKNTFTKKITK